MAIGNSRMDIFAGVNSLALTRTTLTIKIDDTATKMAKMIPTDLNGYSPLYPLNHSA